jgi:nucleotidyltransferase substrate binding protein (TIGR01987 family)
MANDIRWKQRFNNFERAYHRFNEALLLPQLSELEKNGLIQRFEFTIELLWNTIKDYLQEEGIDFKPTPKETIRQAFHAGLIEDAQILIDALSLRNELSHDYDNNLLSEAEEKIRFQIAPAIEKLYQFFKTKLHE